MSFLLKPPHKVHGIQADSSYIQPPIDGSLTIPEIYDFNYKHNRDHPVFVHPDGLGGSKAITFSEVVPAAHEAGRFIAKAAGVDLNQYPTGYPMVGILAVSGKTRHTTPSGGEFDSALPSYA
jgi:hypothetical protein